MAKTMKRKLTGFLTNPIKSYKKTGGYPDDNLIKQNIKKSTLFIDTNVYGQHLQKL